MIPILIKLGPLKIYTFGVFLLLAFFWGCFLLWRTIKLTPYKEDEVFDGLFISLAGGLLFSRLIFVILNFDKFGFDILKFILVNGFPGLSLYGWFFGFFLSLFLFTNARKIEYSRLVDYFIPPFFLSLVIGKIGSFLAGVDVGTKTDLIIATNYVGYKGMRHITPVYEAILFAIGVYFSFQILMGIRREKLGYGVNFYFFLFIFSLINILLDKIKENHLYFGNLSFNMIVSVPIVIITGLFLIYNFRDNIKAYVKPAAKNHSDKNKKSS